MSVSIKPKPRMAPTQHCTFRLNPDQILRLDAATQHFGCTRSELMRAVLPEVMDAIEAQIAREKAQAVMDKGVLAKRRMGEGRRK